MPFGPRSARPLRSVAAALAMSGLLLTSACGKGVDSASQSSGGSSSPSSSSSVSESPATQESESSTPTSEATAPAAEPAPTTTVTRTPKAPISTSAVATKAPTTVTPDEETDAEGTNAPVDLTEVTTPEGSVESGAAVTAQALNKKINGKTMTYAFTASGNQHLYTAQPEGTVIASANSESLTIDFGDGTEPDGANLGAMTCMPKSPLAPFSDALPASQHTYAKSGTYTVKMTTYFCGDAGIASKSSTQTVTIP